MGRKRVNALKRGAVEPWERRSERPPATRVVIRNPQAEIPYPKSIMYGLYILNTPPSGVKEKPPPLTDSPHAEAETRDREGLRVCRAPFRSQGLRQFVQVRQVPVSFMVPHGVATDEEVLNLVGVEQSQELSEVGW